MRKFNLWHATPFLCVLKIQTYRYFLLLKYIKLEILFQPFDFLGGYADALAYLDRLNFAIGNEPINCGFGYGKIDGHLVDSVILL
jgi:hypothetical protein